MKKLEAKEKKDLLHIAVILDGNRRYAKKKGLKPWEGHEKGVENLESFMKWCKESKKVGEITLYVFSTENFHRPKKEKDFLFMLFKKAFKRFSETKKKKKVNEKEMNVIFKFIGRKDLFPKDVRQCMEKLENTSKKNIGITCNVAMGYGSKDEIIDAIKAMYRDLIKKAEKKGQTDRIDEDIDKVTKEKFSKYLYMTEEPDILIRTGGDVRLSNFLLWQLCYSELFFIDKLWPEFSKEDFFGVVDNFYARQRRFGR